MKTLTIFTLGVLGMYVMTSATPINETADMQSDSSAQTLAASQSGRMILEYVLFFDTTDPYLMLPGVNEIDRALGGVSGLDPDFFAEATSGSSVTLTQISYALY